MSRADPYGANRPRRERRGQQADQAASIAFCKPQTGVSDMKRFALSTAAGAIALVCASAFAQDNPPSSNTGLQAGDNAQTTTQHAQSKSHKTSHSKKMQKSATSAGPSTDPGGTATPSGPSAPVSASGSGK